MIFKINQNEITLPKIKRLDQQLDLDAIDNNKLILDFSQVVMMDSEGISWIVSLLNELDKKGVTLEIINVKKEVYKIFEITMLDTILSIKMGT